MNMKSRLVRRARPCVAASLVLAALAVAPHHAQADVFSPIPSPPVVVITASPRTIEPNYPESTTVYTVSATVSTNATLAALNTVSMCWYRSGGDATCSTLNPANAFQMVWTEANATSNGTGGFAVSVGTFGVGFDYRTNRYANAGSQTETTTNTASYSSGAQSMTIEFSFKVSSAMEAGSDWFVKVTAVYDENLCNNAPCTGVTEANRTGSAFESTRAVSYWGALTTTQERMGFGVVAENGTSELRTANSFDYVANATSDYSMVGTDFFYDLNDTSSPPTTTNGNPVDTLTLVAGGGLEAAGLSSKQVRLECKATTPAPAPASTDFVEVDKDGERLGVTISATGESPVTTGAIDCKLSYGGGATNALSIYSSAVTLSILQKVS